ncbi:MAG: hypothetical protein IKO46_06040 [Salinivirgaceae bacterium]|nr:hypothetical protein [Salinivirgaceae bacterium]
MNKQTLTPAQYVEAYHWFMRYEWNIYECRYLFGRDAEHLYMLYEKYESEAFACKWGADDLFFSILKDDEKERLANHAAQVWREKQQPTI